MSCLTKVRSAIDAMTTGEKKLAQLLLSDPQLVLRSSAKDIGESCGVSPASVVRFARMLGFDSLRDMKDDLHLDVMQQAQQEQQVQLNFSDSLENMASCLSAKIAAGMQAALNLQNFDDIRRAVALIAQADTVYLYGVGASSLPALDLQQKLVRVNKRAIYRDDHDLGVLDALYMSEKDLLIAFSYSGRTREVNMAVRQASERNVPCIAVTKFGRSPLASLATFTLPLPESEQDVRYAAVQSKYSSFLLVELLFVGYIQHSGMDVQQQLETTRATIRQLKEKAE